MNPASENMIEPPTRADVAKLERTAKRILTFTQNQDIRNFCKGFLGIAEQIDKYVESLYPCFSMLEHEIRHNDCELKLEPDGVFRLRDAKDDIIITGSTLKDLLINLVLWQGEWPEEEFLEDCATEEDDIFEPDRRKTPKRSQ